MVTGSHVIEGSPYAFNMRHTARRMADARGESWPRDTSIQNGIPYSYARVGMVGMSLVGVALMKHYLEKGVVEHVQVVSGGSGEEMLLFETIWKRVSGNLSAERAAELRSRFQMISGFEELNSDVAIVFDATPEELKAQILTQGWTVRPSLNFASISEHPDIFTVRKRVARQLENEELRRRLIVIQPHIGMADAQEWQVTDVEILFTRSTGFNFLATAREMAQRAGQRLYFPRSSGGYFAYAVFAPVAVEVIRMLQEGETPVAVDQAATAVFGRPVLPLIDFLGTRQMRDRIRIVGEELGPDFGCEVPDLLTQLVDGGFLGSVLSPGQGGVTLSGEPTPLVQAHLARTGVKSSPREILESRLRIAFARAAVRAYQAGVVQFAPGADALVRAAFGFSKGPFEIISDTSPAGLDTIIGEGDTLAGSVPGGERFRFSAGAHGLAAPDHALYERLSVPFVWASFDDWMRSKFGATQGDYYGYRSRAMHYLGLLPFPIHHHGVEHVAVVVRDNQFDKFRGVIDRELGLGSGWVEDVPDEKVHVAIFPMPRGHFLEVITPSSPDSTVARHLGRNEPGIHHIAFAVENLPAARARYEERGLRVVGGLVRNVTRSRSSVFLQPSGDTGNTLIELVESPRTDVGGDA